jgi:predicted kinase
MLSESVIQDFRETIHSSEEPNIVVMTGPSGSGKSLVAKALRNKDTVILSSDEIREWLTGSAKVQSYNNTVFSVLHRVLAIRCENKCSTIVDTTALRKKIVRGFWTSFIKQGFEPFWLL